MQKKSQSDLTVGDLGMNTIYGFTETGLKHHDDEKLWHLQSSIFVTIRVDRNP